MLDFIIPSEKNGYKAHFIKIPALILITIFLALFNLLAKSSISAQDYTNTINSENLLIEHNKLRESNNLPSLKLNAILINSALSKAQEMLETNCWSHFCPPGVDPWKYFDDAGYIYVYAGENLAEGFTSLDEVMNAWMNSKTHRENILKKEFQEVGFGIISGSYQNRANNLIIVAHFGTQASYVSADVNSNNINILSPKPNETIDSNFINVNGEAKGVNNLQIYNNAEYKASPSILDGVFTYRIEDPIQGKNIVSVSGNTINGSVLSSVVEVNVNLKDKVEGAVSVKSDSSITGLNVTTQNAVNFGFVIFFALLFLVDFIALSRTHVINLQKSFSQYHFAILLIVGIIMVIGGFNGNVGIGIFSLP